MTWQEAPYAPLQLGNCLLLLLCAAFAWPRRRAPGARYFMLLTLVQAGWSREALFAGVLALQGLLYQQARFVRFQGASVYQPTSWPVVVAMVAFWAALLLRPRKAHA